MQTHIIIFTMNNTSPASDILIVKHNNLINARYNLTLQEQRIILWLI